MKQIRRALCEEWDRVLAHILFIAYGVLALIVRPPNQSQTPEFFAILFNVEFITLGVLLLWGTIRQNYLMKVAGYVLYVIALLTTAGLIAFTSGSVIYVLVIAFAVRGVTSILELQHGRKFISELRRVLDRPSGDGDERS